MVQRCMGPHDATGGGASQCHSGNLTKGWATDAFKCPRHHNVSGAIAGLWPEAEAAACQCIRRRQPTKSSVRSEPFARRERVPIGDHAVVLLRRASRVNALGHSKGTACGACLLFCCHMAAPKDAAAGGSHCGGR